MKILIVCASLLMVALAEPPVDNRYLPPQQGFSGGRAPSQNYGPPAQGAFGAQRQTDAVFRRPSSNYGAPGQSNRPTQGFRAPQPSSQYGPPGAGPAQPSNQYGAPGIRQSQPSNQYGAPGVGQSQPSNQYGAPGFGSSQPSSQYGAPGVGSSQPSSQYGAPGVGSQPSNQYGPPARNMGARPGSMYGAPGFGNQQQSNGAQSRQYLPPGEGNGGYGDDESNGEPANYMFEYMVKDEQSGNDFGHRESRQGDRAEGKYYVLLPDGRKQTVEYEADQDGYRPKISYEDVGAGQGYDRNSQAQGGYQNSGGPY